MARIDLARRAEIGREKRARTRAQIVEAGATLLAEQPPEALTVDAIVEAAGVAKGTFYYHFQSIEELAAAVGEKLAESFDELLAPARLSMRRSYRPHILRLHPILDKGNRGPRLGAARGPKCAGSDRVSPERSRQSQDGSHRGEGSAPLDRGGCRACGRHRLGHFAWSNARHSSATGRTRFGTPGSRRWASSHWRVPATAATEGR